jgi:hypothetical protein
VRIDPAARRLQGEARIAFRHHRSRPLLFFLHEELEVLSVLLDGKETSSRVTSATLPYIKDTRAHEVSTKTGAPPREVTELKVRYAGRLPSDIAAVNGIGPERVELAAYAAWYPVVKGASGMLTSELEVRLPARFKVVSRGRRVSADVAGGGRVERWRASIPGHDVTVVASPRFRQLSGGGVRLLHTALPEPFARRLLDLCRRALSALHRRLGPASDAPLSVVLSPRGGWGYSRPGLVVISEEQARKGIDDPAALRRTVHGIAHEMGHLWWHLADAGTANDWINEALAEHSALRTTEALFGPEEAAEWQKGYLEHLEAKRPPISIARTKSNSAFRYVNWYERGALLFDALEREVGRGRLDRFLADLHRTQRRSKSPLSTSGLLRDIGASLGKKARALVERRFHAKAPKKRWLARERARIGAETPRRAELRFVLDKLERVYSHLEIKQKRHAFSYPELRLAAVDRVRRCRTDAEHLAALRALLGRFRDGHLKLVLPDDRPEISGPAVTSRWLRGRVLLTRIARLFGDQRAIRRELLRGLKLLGKARGLIVDLRGNPGGNNSLSFDYVARLFETPIRIGKSSARLSPEVLARRPHYREIYPPDPKRPGFARWRDAVIEPKTKKGFAGPIAVLIDKGCYSSCESTALAFKQSGRARLYGAATGGGSANPMAFDLPHTRGKLLVPTWIFVKPGGELLEDNGVRPHAAAPGAADPLARQVSVLLAKVVKGD